jgi:hypothetical protein
MKSTKAIPIIAASIAILASGYIGYEVGVRRGIQEGYSAHVLHTRNAITALRALRTGDGEGAFRMLEVSVDAGVVLMTHHPEMQSDQTAAWVEDALSQVKQYRAAYPWSDGSPELKAKVDGLLGEAQ